MFSTAFHITVNLRTQLVLEMTSYLCTGLRSYVLLSIPKFMQMAENSTHTSLTNSAWFAIILLQHTLLQYIIQLQKTRPWKVINFTENAKMLKNNDCFFKARILRDDRFFMLVNDVTSGLTVTVPLAQIAWFRYARSWVSTNFVRNVYFVVDYQADFSA